MKKIVSEKPFKIKKKGSTTFIEGFANKHTVDRGNDIIATDAWDLENFKKNPVILFNHGMDSKLGGIPVGKAEEVKATDDGLFLKVKLSESDHPEVSLIRDLVEEGILRAFSVGFEPKEQENIDVEGKSINRITKAELFETSIVGIPMNQDSIFTISEKMLKTKSIYEIKKDFLKQKKAWVAAAAHLRLHELEALGKNKKSLLSMIAEKTEMSIDEIKEILSGDEKASEDFLKVASEVLGMELQEFASLEVESEKEMHSDEEDDKEKAKDEEDKKEEKAEDCVSEKIRKLIDEGMDQDQAVAVAISFCQEEGKCTFSDEQKLSVYNECFRAIDEYKASGEFHLDLSEFLGGIEKQAQDENVSNVTEAIQTSRTIDDLSSPLLDNQKQTNVLLGTLISEMQHLRSEMRELLLSSTKTETTETLDETKESNQASDETVKEEILDETKKQLENLDIKLKNLGY